MVAQEVLSEYDQAAKEYERAIESDTIDQSFPSENYRLARAWLRRLILRDQEDDTGAGGLRAFLRWLERHPGATSRGAFPAGPFPGCVPGKPRKTGG